MIAKNAMPSAWTSITRVFEDFVTFSEKDGQAGKGIATCQRAFRNSKQIPFSQSPEYLHHELHCSDSQLRTLLRLLHDLCSHLH